MRFRNCLCQRQPQPDSLGILGKTAPVKPFKNMGQVFRMDTFAIVSYDNLDNGGKFTPFNPDFGPFVRMVKGIFNNIANRLQQPDPVARKSNRVITGQNQALSLLFQMCIRDRE